MVEIVRDMQLQLFELYKASRNPACDDTELISEPLEPHTTGDGQSAHDMGQLEAFAQPPLVDTEFFMPFDSFDGQI